MKSIWQHWSECCPLYFNGLSEMWGHKIKKILTSLLASVVFGGVSARAVVLESGLGLETFFYRLGLVLDSLVFGLGLVSDSPNVQVGLDRVQQYMLFFSLSKQRFACSAKGNVIAIGLTPSRTGIVIGPSRTGIVIGPLLNAQLRHMSVRAAWRHKLSLFWPQTRCRQVA